MAGKVTTGLVESNCSLLPIESQLRTKRSCTGVVYLYWRMEMMCSAAAADDVITAAGDDDAVSVIGDVWCVSDCAETIPSNAACDYDDAKRLWHESIRLVQLTADETHPLLMS